MSESEQTSEGLEETLPTLEETQAKKVERLQDEMEEYAEMRKSEKEREASEIAELKRKRAERLKERAEEERRLAGQRKEEEARRKAEEEERKRKKAEEEEKRKIEKERRRREAEKRKGPKKPNFTIIKKESGEEIMVEEEEEEKAPTKSKEVLEREKQQALAQRVAPLADMSDFSEEQLEEAAKELHNQIRNLISHEYDMEEKYKRMQYDIVELQERTRAMSKIKKKGVSRVQYDDSYDRMNDRFQQAPPKILVANKYEGNLDRRSWKEKVDCYNKKEDYVDINKNYNDYIDQTFDSLYFAGGL